MQRVLPSGNGSGVNRSFNNVTDKTMFAGLAIATQDAYNLCQKCNKNATSSEFQKRINLYSSQLRYSPSVRSFYLPEEDYDEKYKPEQQESLNRDNRNLSPEYRSLCEFVTKKVRLDDTDYEYQPPHYHEVYCKSYSLSHNLQRAISPQKQKCVHPGFHCIQRSKTLFLVRRRWDSECWEPFAKEIPSGCDCMWPVSILGDITEHY